MTTGAASRRWPRSTCTVYQSQDALVQSLKAGDIDFAEGIDPLQIKALEGQSGITAQQGDSPGFSTRSPSTPARSTSRPASRSATPTRRSPNPKFRFALNFAIDRQQIVDKAYQGAGIPAENIIPPAYKGYVWQPPSDDAFAYDPDKAKQLLDEAGYTVGSRRLPDDARRHADRQAAAVRPVRLRDVGLQRSTFFQEWLEDVDIDSKVTSYESNKLTNIILDGEFDIFEWGWYVEPDPDSMLSYFTCDQRGIWSDSWYCNEEYDKLYNEQHAATDRRGARRRSSSRCRQILYEDAPYLVTAYDTIGEAYRSDRWEGFVPQPNPGGVLLFQYGIANYLNIAPAGTASGTPGRRRSRDDGIAAAR